MADISKFSIVTYERKPGHWRAAITRKVRAGIVVGGDKVRSIVSEAKILSELAAKNPRVPTAGEPSPHGPASTDER